MRFVAEILLGNEAMQSRADVFETLRAALLVEPFEGDASLTAPLRRAESGSLRDANGNTVGSWRVVLDLPGRPAPEPETAAS